jgi:hypothetical protein
MRNIFDTTDVIDRPLKVVESLLDFLREEMEGSPEALRISPDGECRLRAQAGQVAEAGGGNSEAETDI